jgi:predicted GNAT family N-acyltransferase
MADWEHEKEDLIRLRTLVFVEEQRVPVELEMDDYDAIAMHAKAITLDQKMVATARLLPNRYVGRMCVLKEYRKRGIGGQMLQFLIDHARQNAIPELHLNAQVSALPFYREHGFRVVSDEFEEAGIPHQKMTLILPG